MRFHATLTHTAESCPGPRGGTARASEVGVELISAVGCQPAHTQFYVVETDDYSKFVRAVQAPPRVRYSRHHPCQRPYDSTIITSARRA